MNTTIMANNQNNQLGMVEERRALSEIKGKIFLAKQFPRNEQDAIDRILRECQQERVANEASYVYTRGTEEVNGASIRLAEVVARHWGNFDSGVVELERRDGESTVKTYAWDLESNYRDEKIFSVKHERETKKGAYKVTGSRDIYELVANSAARRKRACILAVIPGYVFDLALEECEKTLKGNIGDITEAREKMYAAFVTLKEDVTKEQIASVVGKDFDHISEQDIVKLRRLYSTVKDGFVSINAALKLEEPGGPTLKEQDELAGLNERIIQ